MGYDCREEMFSGIMHDGICLSINSLGGYSDQGVHVRPVYASDKQAWEAAKAIQKKVKAENKSKRYGRTL